MKIEKAIIVCGKIRSGKSSFAQKLMTDTTCCIASFGDFLKHSALEQGLPITREHLQSLGEDLIRKDSSKFLLDVINFSCNNASKIIFDGVRHLSILKAIKSISATSISIYLDVSDSLRLERYLTSCKSIDVTPTIEDFYERSSHNVEFEIESLKSQCNYVLSNEYEVNQLLLYLTSF